MSQAPSHLTVGQVAEIFQAPGWKVRRIVDSLGVEIPRAGLYRLIPRELLGRIGVELEQGRGSPKPSPGPASDARQEAASP